MRVKIYFLLIIFIMALLPVAACTGNPPESADSGEPPENPDTDAVSYAEQTPAPTLTAKTFLSADRYCIVGKGAEGAAIRVEGGLQPVTGTIVDGQFIVEVFLENQTSRDVDLSIYAKSDGFAESEPLTVTARTRESRDYKPLYIGKDNQIHYNETIDDFLGRALFQDDELDLIKRGAENLQQLLIDEGLNTKLIIFVSPNPGTIYPETMSDMWADQIVSNNSRLKQLTELFKDSSVKFINPYDRFMREKENYFIYNRTDTHWNELGAYFGYSEIFGYIGETFPAAKPIPLDDFDVFKATVRGGDLIPMLQFDQDAVTETAYIVRIKNPKVHELFRKDTNEIAYQEPYYHGFLETSNAGDSKPTIIMYRDSFSISMMSPIAETSDRVIFNNMWDYNIDIEFVKAVNPDFIIIQRVERILYDLPSAFRRFR